MLQHNSAGARLVHAAVVVREAAGVLHASPARAAVTRPLLACFGIRIAKTEPLAVARRDLNV